MRLKILPTDIVVWTEANPEIHRQLSEQTGHMEIETMKLVLKSIALERETMGCGEDSFQQMMRATRENLQHGDKEGSESAPRKTMTLAEAKANSGMMKAVNSRTSSEWVSHPKQLKSTSQKSNNKNKAVKGGQVG